MIDLGSPRSSFEIFAALASNDLFMRRWIALCEDPEVTRLADDTLDNEERWYEAREALRGAIRAGIEDLQRLAEATVPDVFTTATMRHLHELCYDAHLGMRRQARERIKIRVTLVVDPDDGEALDEEHLAIVNEATDAPLDPEGWRRLRERLAACTRPAKVWTSDRAIQVEWDAPDATPEESPVPEIRVPPPPFPPSSLTEFETQFSLLINEAMGMIRERVAIDPSWVVAVGQDLRLLEEFVLPTLIEGLRRERISLAAFDEGVASMQTKFNLLFRAIRVGLEQAA